MRSTVISLLLAASVAATAPLTPVHAQGFDPDARRTAAALAFGIATLAIIARAAEAERDREKDRKKAREKEREREKARAQVITRADQSLPRVLPRDRPEDYAHRRGLRVPSSCARRVQFQNGVRTAFGAPCLRRAGVDIQRLPDRCERRARTNGRDVRIWGARCLTRNGVRIE
ncbi:MAG: hypothetical protein AAF646_09195 [Pseudomonadota bacterium]